MHSSVLGAVLRPSSATGLWASGGGAEQAAASRTDKPAQKRKNKGFTSIAEAS